MGYEVRVMRGEAWFQTEKDSNLWIGREEWLDYIKSDPELRLDGFAESKVGGGEQRLRIEQPGLAVWLAYSGNGQNGNFAWITWYKGTIVVNNPDDEIVEKLCRIAKPLKAKVQGDDLEDYCDFQEPPRPFVP